MNKQFQITAGGQTISIGIGASKGKPSTAKHSRRHRSGKRNDMIPCHGTAHDGTKVESATGQIVGQAKDKFLITCSDGRNIGAHGLKRLYEIQVACQHGIDLLNAKQQTSAAGQ